MKLQKRHIAAAIISLIPLSILLINYNTIPSGMWTYFDSMSLVARSSVLHYGVLPLHDPWTCGGTDVLANPYNWIFSPTLILTLLFPPHIGNILILMIFSLLGFFAFYKLALDYKFSKNISLLIAFLFVNNSWFADNFAQGLMFNRTYLLLPLLFLLLKQIFRIKIFAFFVLLLSFFILDGNLSIILILSCLIPIQLLTDSKWYKLLRSSIKNNPREYLLLSLSFVFISFAKIYPLTIFHKGITYKHHIKSLDIIDLLTSIFIPTHTIYQQVLKTDIQESAPYIGFFLLATLIFWAIKANSIKKNIWPIIAGMFFLWSGTNFLTPYTPWTFLHYLNLFQFPNSSSFFIAPCMMIMLILFGKALSSLVSRNKTITYLLALIVSFIWIVNSSNTYIHFLNNGRTNTFPSLIKSKNIVGTKEQINKPDVYIHGNYASIKCDDPYMLPTFVKHEDDPLSKGHYFIIKGKTKIKKITYTPGRIEINHQTDKEAYIIINTNNFGSFTTSFFDNNSILNQYRITTVKLTSNETKTVLRYLPIQIFIIIFLLFIGIYLTLVIINKQKNHES